MITIEFIIVHAAIAALASTILISQASLFAFLKSCYTCAVILRNVISFTRAAAYTYPLGFLGQ